MTTGSLWITWPSPRCGELSAKDDKTVLSVLDAVAIILTTAETDKVAIMVEECGGLDRIEKLQSHESKHIYHKALDIIETFFPDGDQIDKEIVPRKTKADVFGENETGKGGMGYMGGKKARAAAREKNLRHNRTTTRPGRGQNLHRKT
jgi:hypothetical protein